MNLTQEKQTKIINILLACIEEISVVIGKAIKNCSKIARGK